MPVVFLPYSLFQSTLPRGERQERSGFLMATLDEDELYAVQNFIAGMKATKEYVKMQEKEKEKAENPE